MKIEKVRVPNGMTVDGTSIIKKWLVVENTKVKVGEVIAHLESGEYIADFEVPFEGVLKGRVEENKVLKGNDVICYVIVH